MAIEITNKISDYDKSDLTIDTENKSLIKINSTSYNVFDNWFEFIRKYFGVDDYNDPYISTLKSSFFGYFNELASSEIKNAVYHKNFLYDEHFLNTAVLPESIYNFAKLYNVPIENSVPASMLVSISVLETELVNSSLIKEIREEKLTNSNSNTLKVYNLTIDRNTYFAVDTYRFMLPYPLIITIQELVTESEQGNKYSYSFTANYDTSANKFPILENQGIQPYLKVWRETIDGQRYLFIGCELFQMTKNSKNIVITTTNEDPSTRYHDISFNNQLSYFEVFYEFNGKIYPVNLYFNNIYTPTENEYYAYYTYLNDKNIQISFSSEMNGFRPAIGSTLVVNTYTTLGYKGNFNYSGGVTMNFLNNNTFERLSFNCETLSDGSANGKDKLDTYGQKLKILEAIVTRNNIITDNDLIKFFDSVNESLNINGSTIKFLKKQDDVIRRIYCNFLLLRDENKRVIPTNTAPYLKIKKSDLEQTKQKGKYVIREHSIVQCNYVRDVINYNALLLNNKNLVIDNFDNYFNQEEGLRYSQDYIKYILNNNYFQDILDDDKKNYLEKTAFENIDSIYNKMITSTAEVASDELVYTVPFMITLEDEPFLRCTYYNVDVNAETSLSYEYLNNKIGASFSISTLKIEKDIKPSASNKFTLDSNVYKLSFNLNTNLSYDDLRDKVVIKCVIVDKNDNKTNYGHFFFKLKDVNTNNSGIISNFSYKYEADLATDYSFSNGQLNLYNCIYRIDSRNNMSQLYEESSIPEDVVFRIGILYYDPVLSLTQSVNEKSDWRFKFPAGFIEENSRPNEIPVTNFVKSSELVSFNNGYIEPESIMLVPCNETINPKKNYFEPEENDEDENNTKKKSSNSSYTMLSNYYNINNYVDGKVVIKFHNKCKDPNSLSFDGFLKILVPNINNNPDKYAEIGHRIRYPKKQDDNNENVIIDSKLEQNGESYITITINNIAKIQTPNKDTKYEDIISYAKIINKCENNNEDEETFTRDNDYINMNGNLGYSIIRDIVNMRAFEINLDYINLIKENDTGNPRPVEEVLQEVELESVNLYRTDLEISSDLYSRDNIDNYVLATIISNPTPLKMYQNMSSIMSSIVTYDEENEEYSIELVPLISLRYYMSRPKLIYDLINRFIKIVDSVLPRLEENTNCDMKFYNTYGPSRYFYFNKETISKTIYKDKETNEEILDMDENFNPYVNTVVSEESRSLYNYLGRTDIILDFTIHLYENITSEKDEEIKKYISDYVEEANNNLILPISNLITKLQNNFSIIKYIKYNGIFSDVVDSNNSSKNNDYQLIDNDFDFNKMNKEEIRTYVPEYLNLKKDVVKIRENYNPENIFEILNYSTYDYIITIKYKV